MEFVVGDLLMLSMHDLCIYNNCKFAACFIGPFRVLKHIGKLAYHVEVPPIYSILHNVFHVSKLKLFVSGGGDGTRPMYSRFWLMVKNSMRLRRPWQNMVMEIASSTWFIGLDTWLSIIYGCLNLG